MGKLTRDEDKALWVEVRLKAAWDEGRARTVFSMVAVRKRLEIAYERLNPVMHAQPQVKRYGHRLTEWQLMMR